MKKYAMLLIILLMYGSPALAQRYGVKGSWHITDTLFVKYIVPESTKIGIVFRNNDTVYFPLVYVDTIRHSGQQLMVIPDTAYFNANNDPTIGQDTAAVSIKTYRHSGVSILQVEGLGDSSYAFIWLNVRDSVNAATDINRSPYFEWNAYKHTGMKGSVISQLTRKGGKDASGNALNTILYLGMEGDSTVIDSLRIRGIGSYTNLFYNQVRTPDSNVTTKGQVKTIVKDTTTMLRALISTHDSILRKEMADTSKDVVNDSLNNSLSITNKMNRSAVDDSIFALLGNKYYTYYDSMRYFAVDSIDFRQMTYGVSPESIIAAYSFNRGNANDISGNGNNGTVTGANWRNQPDSSVDGKGAYSFWGSPGVSGQYVTVNAPTGFPTGNHDISLSYWTFSQDWLNNTHYSIGWGGWGTSNQCFMILHDAGARYIYVNLYGNARMYSVTQLQDNRLYNIVATYHASDSTAALYINGKLDSTRALISKANFVNTRMRIGSDINDGISYPAVGVIYDNVVWAKRVFTSQEIQNLYNNGIKNKFGIITVDSINARAGRFINKVQIDTIQQRKGQVMLISDTTLRIGLGYNNPDTAALSLKTYGHRGQSILQIESVGDSSGVYLWMNARDGVSPYVEWNMYKDTAYTGDFISTIQRKGGNPVKGNITYLGFEGDSTVIDTLRVRGEGSFDNKFYHKVETPDSNIATYGGVKLTVHDSIKSSLYFRESIPWDKLIAYSKMDNADTSITWYPADAKPFSDSGSGVPIASGLLWNCLDFTGAANLLKRGVDANLAAKHFTFMTFFKHDASAALERILRVASDDNSIGWILEINTEDTWTKGASFYFDTGGSYVISDSTNGNWDDNNWHFICATSDSANGFMSLQIDNSYSKHLCTVSSATVYNSANQTFWMGYSPTTANFNGYIDDWMYFNTALTRSQVEMVRQMLLGTVFNTNVK